MKIFTILATTFALLLTAVPAAQAQANSYEKTLMDNIKKLNKENEMFHPKDTTEQQKTTVTLKNYTKRDMLFRLYNREASETTTWKGAESEWLLPQRMSQRITIACTRGQLICYGAWQKDTDGSTYWGEHEDRSLISGDRSADCFMCGYNSNPEFNIREEQAYSR